MTARRYRAEAPERLRIVPLDALTLVYHRASGVTHLVDSPVPELLDLLAAGPLDLDALLVALAARFDLVDADRAALLARLEELAAAGLVSAA